MKSFLDRTGTLTRVVGLGGLLLLVATAATLREPPPEPTAKPPPSPQDLPPVQPVPQVGSGRMQRIFPEYPKATVIPMGRLEANGNPMEMAYFETPGSAPEVLEFYAREFRRRGHRVVNQPDGAGGGAVNYYDATRGALISVTAIGVGGKQPRTLVFPSIVDAPQGVHLKSSVPDSLPRPPGAVTVLRVDDSNPGPAEGSTTVTEVATGTPRMLADFYLEQLRGRGFSQVESRSGAQGVESRDFERPGERISLSISPVSKDGVPESFVTVVLERTTPTEEHRP
ncbi:hypothetical protein [Pyxidicoccus sp. MSG2]|uniref:hypothetical protein n=1 Tax=Pyxidicoccus sp. MSG2 TaxID=2996790 RepID=UPI0022718F79|nr:hypothetical protein [Pyxidicoccus sp. MSG2]MCY1017181.1 hypothetical protein [Pyxidicoccus sp. MSG2]